MMQWKTSFKCTRCHSNIFLRLSNVSRSNFSFETMLFVKHFPLRGHSSLARQLQFLSVDDSFLFSNDDDYGWYNDTLDIKHARVTYFHCITVKDPMETRGFREMLVN